MAERQIVGNDAAALRRYHELTKHSLERIQRSPHRLLWEIQPLPFKIYDGLEPIALPREIAPLGMPALDAIARTVDPGEAERHPTLGELASLLFYSAGITKERVYPGGQRVHFRAAPCTGALYHIDLYLVCGDLDGLEAGVYHFGPHDFALRRLRVGDYRAHVVAASGEEPAIARAPALLVCASTFWRNAWKYRERTYRHCWWDCGTLLAQLLAAATATGIPVRIVLGFVDSWIDALLGLDADREASLVLVSIGSQRTAIRAQRRDLEPLALVTRPLSSREIDYPLIREAHAASALQSPEDVVRWRGGGCGAPSDGGETIDDPRARPLEPLADPPSEPLSRTILRRGSTRRFARAGVDFARFSTIIARSFSPVPLDVHAQRAAGHFDELYVIAHAVDDLDPGSYAFVLNSHGTGHGRLLSLRRGNFRREAGFLGLGQELPADAAANLYFLGDLEEVFARLGGRGYRAAQLEAAIHGGRAYLAAYALGLGATGLTFFDDDVTKFFSPHAAGKSVLFLVAVGRPAARRAAAG